ncbi:hypothetical protein [Pseudoalteromonas luteoviolacea]|uniref:hypothetical protein n=1 Tax=Pseudoalteromonas luteoviolacea TaxID=43657 RepID=UPI001B36EA78|nr:hypothetical protein [Pseudoalteromonas luteoviolacea]MBQ4835447.1 hypothetical protein [Pseudoalteromonas luteoviolacea]
MLGKGTQWHVAHDGGPRLVINILSALSSSGDRSLYGFQATDIDGMKIDSGDFYNIYMNGKGNDWYECTGGYVVTGMYFYHKGDRSVEMFECSNVVGKRRHPYMVVYRHADIDGPVACGKYGMWNTYATGFYYQDEGDDRIIYMKCSLLIA